MRRALGLAARARGRTAPNPMVGAVVVRGGRRIAAGYHARAGGPHAEARALAKAGARARGATLYVTLEPCAHQGRTPPCAEAVLASGVRRVVCGMRDPDPRTAGRSVARLRRAGIEVLEGVEEPACRELLRGFRSRIGRGRPYTVLKLAASLDGRIATRSGHSRWISGPVSRARVHRMREAADGVVVGSGTVLADDPALTARSGARALRRPTRVVVDSRLRTPRGARLLRGGGAVVLTAREAPVRRARALERAGAQVLRVPARAGHLDLRAAWRALGRLGLNEVLVEGGGGLAAALLRAGLVDRLYLFAAPLLIGGDGRALLGPLGVDRLADALRPSHLSVRRSGADLLLIAEW